MKKIILFGAVAFFLSGCSHWSNQMEKSPCACDFTPMQSNLA